MGDVVSHMKSIELNPRMNRLSDKKEDEYDRIKSTDI
jgi:hypothetical protein